MRKLRSQRDIQAERNRVHAALITKRAFRDYDWAYLQGAQQALAWALSDNAMAPTKLYAPKPKRKKPTP